MDVEDKVNNHFLFDNHIIFFSTSYILKERFKLLLFSSDIPHFYFISYVDGLEGRW